MHAAHLSMFENNVTDITITNMFVIRQYRIKEPGTVVWKAIYKLLCLYFIFIFQGSLPNWITIVLATRVEPKVVVEEKAEAAVEKVEVEEVENQVEKWKWRQ